MIVQLDHINIVVSNLQQARDFFLAFGCFEQDRAHLHGAWISTIVGLEAVDAEYLALSFPGSALTIELIEYHQPQSPAETNLHQANRLGFRHLAVAVQDIEGEVARLAERGIHCRSSIQTFSKSGKKLVYFLGPDGILLELAEYPQ